LVEQATDITVDDCYECRPAPETMEEDIETDDSTTDDDDDDNQGAVHGRIAHPPPDSLCRAEMHLVGVAAEEPAMTEDIADSMARAEVTPARCMSMCTCACVYVSCLLSVCLCMCVCLVSVYDVALSLPPPLFFPLRCTSLSVLTRADRR